ncbi:MAG: hypothetical protein EOL97_12640 [Spirochaetia bacterium]|nr:hypothetical protein [Spirochaetia bacterium]
MKKLILFIAVITVLTACNQPTKKYLVYAKSDHTTSSLIECDSFTMVSQSHIIIYVDSVKSDIYASNIKIQSNQYYKK